MPTGMSEGRWTEVEPSSHPHEREALDFARRRPPDFGPGRGWSNVRLLVKARPQLFCLCSHPGGDPNPVGQDLDNDTARGRLISGTRPASTANFDGGVPWPS